METRETGIKFGRYEKTFGKTRCAISTDSEDWCEMVVLYLYPLDAGLCSQLLHNPPGMNNVIGTVSLWRHPVQHNTAEKRAEKEQTCNEWNTNEDCKLIQLQINWNQTLLSFKSLWYFQVQPETVTVSLSDCTSALSLKPFGAHLFQVKGITGLWWCLPLGRPQQLHGKTILCLKWDRANK